MESVKENEIQRTNFGFQFDYSIEDKEYSVQVVYPSKEDDYTIPYILVIPKQMKDNCVLAVEVNNLETKNKDELLNNGLLTAYNLISNLKEFDNPVLIPILPSVEGGPYYQQLSRECFSVSKDSPFYRIDLQVLNIISEVKQKISKIVTINEKIFLNGYSCSGVFAQRFALLHPKIIDTACIGGASGSIPVPITELEYPLGIADYLDITGEKFDLESYSQIKFRYYVGSLEDKRKTSERHDENGNDAPMHDMSYFDRSIPPVVGMKQRNMFGINMIERSKKQIDYMNDMGINIEQEIFKGRTHNNHNGIGVNELGDEFINRTYQQSFIQGKKL